VPCFLEILDTAGQETFTALRELYMQNGQGFALVYSITNRPTFDFIDKLRDQILDFQPPDVPMVLVGNKLDLDDKRKVSLDTAQKKAKLWNIPFVEVSAKNDINIAEIFHLLIDLCWDREGGPPQQKNSRSRCELL
jgi:small GTP-binding protein